MQLFIWNILLAMIYCETNGIDFYLHLQVVPIRFSSEETCLIKPNMVPNLT